MQINRAAEANHAVAISHNVAFSGGTGQTKLKLRAGDVLGLDFVDRNIKVCMPDTFVLLESR